MDRISSGTIFSRCHAGDTLEFFIEIGCVVKAASLCNGQNRHICFAEHCYSHFHPADQKIFIRRKTRNDPKMGAEQGTAHIGGFCNFLQSQWFGDVRMDISDGALNV